MGNAKVALAGRAKAVLKLKPISVSRAAAVKAAVKLERLHTAKTTSAAAKALKAASVARAKKAAKQLQAALNKKLAEDEHKQAVARAQKKSAQDILKRIKTGLAAAKAKAKFLPKAFKSITRSPSQARATRAPSHFLFKKFKLPKKFTGIRVPVPGF